jgi:hypothetical protein
MGEIPFPAEAIQAMQLDIVDLSGVLGFLLKLEYGQPLSITIDGSTSMVIYDPKDPEPYDQVYDIISETYIKRMRNLALDIYNISSGKKVEEKLRSI